MNRILLTADLHFGHANIPKHVLRQISNLQPVIASASGRDLADI